MNNIKGRKYTVSTENRIELARFFVKITCILKGISLSKTEELIVSNFLIYGYNKVAKEKIVEQKLVSNTQSLSNTISRFRKSGIVIQDGAYEKLCKEFDGQVGDWLGIQIILNNSHERK